MKKPVRSLACALASVVVCSAAAAEARPVVLTEVEMDDATAGAPPEVAARLAALKSRLQDLREALRERLAERRGMKSNGSTPQSRSWTTTSPDGSTTVHVVSRVSYVSRND